MKASRYLWLFAVWILAGCQESAEVGTPVVDDAGRTIMLPDSVGGIVSLAPNVTELAFAAGLGSRIVGVTSADDHPDEVADIPKVQALPLNHEEVVALAPSLILASDQVNDPRDADALAQLGIPTYFVSIQSLPDVSRSIRALGGLLGTASVANAYADSLERLLGTVDPDGQTGEPSGPTVIFLIGDDTLFSFGPESYVHDMIRAAGGRSLTESLETQAPILSEEYVLDAAPDILMTSFPPDVANLLELHPSWESVPAIQNGRVIGISPDLVLRPGPRLIAGTLEMARALSELR